LQDGELVAQDQDLCALPSFLALGEPQPRRSRVVRRKTNRRHMTGDHYGRTGRTATLLVTVTDEILDTHRSLRACPCVDQILIG